jgi:Asp-tRNA(Asn)/Glu-tRNA(Gln) amidotransferase A subunit family amidase
VTSALLDSSAQKIAIAVKAGRAGALEIAEAALKRIEARNGALGAFTDVTAARARAKAETIDHARARGEWRRLYCKEPPRISRDGSVT